MGAVHHAIAPSLYPKLGYSLKESFVPVALVASVPQVIVVNPSRIAARTLPDFLAYARRNPGRIAFGSAGSGTSHHLAGELFKLETKTFLTHIPYRGAGPALADLVAGQVDVMFDGFGSLGAAHQCRPHRRARGRRRPQGRGDPDDPDDGRRRARRTIALRPGTASGRRAGTAKESVDRMLWRSARSSQPRRSVTHGPPSAPRCPTPTGRAFGDFVDAEIQRWGKVVRTANVKLEG